MAVGWKKGKLFEGEVVAWEQKLMGRHSTSPVPFVWLARVGTGTWGSDSAQICI